MRIGLDVRPLQNASAARGVGRYVRSLIAALADEGEEYLYLCSRWRADPELAPGAPGRIVRMLRPPRAITVFDRVGTPVLCRALGLDLFHSTFYALPAWGVGRTRLVLTVHDLTPMLLPGSAGLKNTAIFAATYRSARRADAVIVPSRRTADDLARRIGVDPVRIRVVPMGVGTPFCALGPDETPEPLREARARGAKLLLYAGGFDKSKNVTRLLDLLRSAGPGPEVILAMAGDPGRAGPGLLRGAAERGAGERLLLLGRLTDTALAAAYREADLFVSASSYEGFGLPALEAMACGCPVVVLETSAVSEVTRGAAVTVDPSEPSRLATEAERVLADRPLRMDLRERGLRRAAELTWERTARETLALYRETVGAAERRRGTA